MLQTREFTNAEVAERLEFLMQGIKLGVVPVEKIEGFVAEACTRLRLNPRNAKENTDHIDEAAEVLSSLSNSISGPVRDCLISVIRTLRR